MTDQPARGGFWTSFPGVLTGIAAVITASAGLFIALGPRPGDGQPTPQNQPANAPTLQTSSLTQPQKGSGETVGAAGSSGVMGPLEPGISYSQGDIYDRPAGSPEECVQLCSNDDRCRAVTYIISQQRCWLKDRVNPAQLSSDMISAKKLH